MIATFVYFGIAFGCNSGGMSVLASLSWPMTIGRWIASRADEGEAGR